MWKILILQGKVLREKKKGESDWKQKLRKGISQGAITLKKHANRISNHLRQWWRGKQAGTSKKGKKTGKSEL